MKRLVAELGSPLFGRADLVLELRELEPSAVFQWLCDVGVAGEEAFKFYMLFGEVPYYYRLAQQWGVKTVEEAVRPLAAGRGARFGTRWSLSWLRRWAESTAPTWPS